MNGPVMRSYRDIAGRYVGLHLLMNRWGLESMWREKESTSHLDLQARVEEACGNLRACASTGHISPVLQPREIKLIERTLGKWTEKDLEKQERRFESLGALKWVLKDTSEGFYTGPVYHFDRVASLQTSNFNVRDPKSIESFLDNARCLRPLDMVLTRYQESQVWHWREQVLVHKQQQLIQARGDLAQERVLLAAYNEKFSSAIREVSSQAAAEGFVDTVVNEDFGYNGVSYEEIEPATRLAIAELNKTRHYTLGWVLSTNDWMDT